MRNILVLMCLLLFINLFCWGQKRGEINYKEGELLVQLVDNYAPERLLLDFEAYGLTYEGQVSKHMNIYRYSFATGVLAQKAVLKEVRFANGVLEAQNNHYIRQRNTFPNDNVPWQFYNTSGSADVDAPEVWDYGVGDLTVQGDQMVVAIFDGGYSIDDSDVNYWKNANEIPDNGIDDDNNGYIDDYDGWNVVDTSGAISDDGGHGHFVSSVLGTIGNNGVGNTGLCWGVEVLPLEIFNSPFTLESVVLAAFDYIINERMIYDATNGADGAFIVSSNHSYGEGGFPSDAPLWCAAYDVAGQLGIVSAGATWNSYYDVDAVGDLPTSCTEDHLITVTAIDPNDNQYQSGYGLNSIDLGSPSNGSTSEATPVVAGTVPLLLSTACESFVQLYKDYPDSAARLIKQYILMGTEQISDLQCKSVTGGRLNAYHAMALLLNEHCGMSFAPVPKIEYSSKEVCVGDEVQFYDRSYLNPTSWTWSFPGGTPSTSTLQNPTVVYENPGVYGITLTAASADGSRTKSIMDLIVVNAVSGNALPYTQDFNNGSDWTVNNPNNDNTWTLTNDPACNDGAYAMDNFGENNQNTSDYLTADFDLSNVQNAQLIFDVAYAQYNDEFSDELLVNARTCGDPSSIVYQKSGSTLATAPNNTEAFAPSDCSEWRSDTVDLSLYDGQVITLEFVNNSGWGNFIYLDNIRVEGEVINSFRFNTKILLEGAYTNDGQMHTNLNAILPLEQPYNTDPYAYGGKELMTTIPANMVDWVLLEARTGTPSLSGPRTTVTVETKAAMLLSDGSLMDVDGQIGVNFNTLSIGQDYYFCIRHRNHLDVLSATPIQAASLMSYDFSTSITQAFGTNQQKLSEDNYALLFAGDYIQDHSLQNTDYDSWKDAPAQINVYQNRDGNLDGVVQATDYDTWYRNRAKLGVGEVGY